jgi:dTDP-4-amino-4,6-dideoxygalactose transaminase
MNPNATRLSRAHSDDEETTWPMWPVCDVDEQEAAARVLRSGKLNYWTGNEGRMFEREFADYLGCKYAIALANGTAALEVALWSLGIGPSDEVIVPSRTFVATASAVVRCGAKPIFADVDRDSQCITAETIQAALTRRTKAVIVVHLAGWPCDMDPILELARKHNLRVIEDCAQAHGALYKGQAVGTLADAGAYSFCQDKIITTAGEGGMLVTSQGDVWERAWSFKDHGKNYHLASRPATSNVFRWLHDRIGTNWRLTEVQSAIGRIALRKLESWVATRRRNSAILDESLHATPALRVPVAPDDVRHSYYKYYAFVEPEKLAAGWNRDRIVEEVNSAGVPCFVGSCSEVYLEAAFSDVGRPPHRLPVANQLGNTSIMLQVHPTLTERHMVRVAETARSVMHRASLPGTADTNGPTFTRASINAA